MTVTLADRWPSASVEGIDSSAEMIDRARTQHGAAPRVRFELGDIRSWSPAEPVDVLLSNATLQWVPGHLDPLPALCAAVRPGGWLGFQVPGNFVEPSHTELAVVMKQPRRRDRLAGAELATPWVAEPADYLQRLVALGAAVDVWETTYLMVLAGDDAVLNWITVTALRPTLSVLSPRRGAHEVCALMKRDVQRHRHRRSHANCLIQRDPAAMRDARGDCRRARHPVLAPGRSTEAGQPGN